MTPHSQHNQHHHCCRQVSILTRKLANYRELGWPEAWELELKLDQEESVEEVVGSDPDDKPTYVES
jgi:hypothetical protein